MNRRPVILDFVARRRRPRLPALLLLAAGAAALSWVGLTVDRERDQLAGIEQKLAERLARANSAKPRFPPDAATVEAAALAAAELATPWTRMLADLEEASAGIGADVALLVVEPDRAQRRVRVLAEARSLAAALAYLKRLQTRGTLRDALLESHEIMTSEPERPVRVQITAAWVQTS